MGMRRPAWRAFRRPQSGAAGAARLSPSVTVVSAVLYQPPHAIAQRLLATLSLIVACVDSTQQGDEPTETDSPWSLGDVRVPMRDGVGLFTDVYLPPGDGPFPAVVTRVPYGKRDDYVYLPKSDCSGCSMATRSLVKTCGGRFGSEGSFAPYAPNDQEGLDAYDTIEWITQQPWSDGNIGMMGESYYGYTSLAGARSGHPALKAVSPANITMAREKQVLDGAYPLQASGLWTLNMDDVEDGEYQDLSRLDLMHLPLITMGEIHGLRDDLWRDRVGGYLHRSADWREQLHRALRAGSRTGATFRRMVRLVHTRIDRHLGGAYASTAATNAHATSSGW